MASMVAVAILAGCKGDNIASALPSDTASAPSLPSSTTDSETKTIEGVYTRLNALLDQADKLPADVRKRQVSAYAIDPQLTRILGHAEELRSKNLTAYGTTIAHVKSVEINEPDAALIDCQDSSKAGLMNTKTNKKINRGIKNDGLKVYLRRSSGSWKVAKIVLFKKACER